MKKFHRYFSITLAISLLGLMACGRDTYTTWSCKNFESKKLTMILNKAQMQFHSIEFNYCGSLGSSSYFDPHCPTQIQDSSIVFIPSSGALLYKTMQYQCDAL